MRVFHFLLIIGLFWSCSNKADVTIYQNLSAKLKLEVNLSKVFETYVSDVAQTLNYKTGTIFDEKRIRSQIESEPGVIVSNISISGPKIVIEAKIDNLPQVMNGKRFKDLGSFKQTGSTNEIILQLGPKLVAKLIEWAQPDKDSALAGLLPKSKSTTKKVYEDQIAWALGDYATKAEMAKVFEASKVQVSIETPSKITKFAGLKKISDTKVLFEIGITELLTLADARQVSVTW